MFSRDQAIAPRTVLAGDIGGTKTRLALFRITGSHLHRIQGKTFPSGDYPGLAEILRDFLKGKRGTESACFGIAGPVNNGSVTTTNLPWKVDRRLLQHELSLGKVTLINDLVANAYGIAVLKKADYVILNPGQPKKGNAVLISAGTGLGEAVLFWNGKHHLPSASEGGHVEFGPRNELEVKLFQYLYNRFGHVSYERILSGAGLQLTYQFLKDLGGVGREPKWLSKKMKQEDPAAVIAKTAELKKSRLCMKAMEMFASIYGAAAGNFALQVMAVGGVYIGGGIAPKIIWKLKDGTFMEAFKNKGRLSDIIARFPVKVIMNDQAALLGAACRAAELLRKR